MIIKINELKDKLSFADVVYENFSYLKNYSHSNHSTLNICNELKKLGTVIYFAIHDNKLIGYLIGIKSYHKNHPIMYISYIYVLDDYRKKGYGKRLMDSANKYCIDNNLDYITLKYHISNEKASIFYKNMGFSVIDENDRDFITVNKNIEKIEKKT